MITVTYYQVFDRSLSLDVFEYQPDCVTKDHLFKNIVMIIITCLGDLSISKFFN